MFEENLEHQKLELQWATKVVETRYFSTHSTLFASSVNRTFSKMAAENSNKLKLAKIKNVYQHWKEHL